jgi:hypothetical protein
MRFILCLQLLIITLPVFAAPSAPNQQQVFMRQFQSSRIQFPGPDSAFAVKNPGRYPDLINFFLQDLISWTPTGIGKITSDKCEPHLWAERLQDARIKPSVALQGAIIQKYFKDCSSELETGHTTSLVNSTLMMTTNLEPQDHPFMHRVVFNLPGNVKLKGFLALKGDFKKRPLVIIRPGIFSNVEEFLPERPWLMMMFEQSPFNALVLENMSGADFIADNTKFSFGGYDEGLQNILIAQMLTDPNEPLQSLVDSIHLVGVSLGGHGVLFASLLNSLNSPKGKPLFQSFMGICSAVKLEESMNNLFSNPLKAPMVDLWAQLRLKGLPKILPQVSEHPSFGYFKTSIAETIRTYHGGLSYVSSIKLPEGMNDEQGFWKLNDFWQFYKDVKEPVLLLATQTDHLVPYALNTQLIQNKTLKTDGSNISAVDFAQGSHCTLPIAYDWKAISSLLQAYVLSHSPTFKVREQTLDMPLDEEAGPEFFKGTLKTSYKFRTPEPKDKFAKLAIEIENDKGKTHEMTLNLPFSQFDFRFLNSELSVSEQWMISRWMNQNLSVKINQVSGKPHLRISWAQAE